MTLAELCVKRPVFAVMLVGFLVVLGVFSFRDLGVDLFPTADPATVTIQVRLPGASPVEMNSQVVMPLEDAVSTVSGLDELTARSQEGVSNITCKFVLERDTESAAQDVREKVAAAMRTLPPNIDPPVIQKVDPDSDPVLTVVVSGDTNLREITEIADKLIKRQLETVNNVGEVTLSGGRPRQIRIFGDINKLNAYGITIDQLERAIQSENVEAPGGSIREGDSETGVRTLGRMDAPEQFGNIIVVNRNGAPIRVNDIGRVEDSYPDEITWYYLQERNSRGAEAVALDVRRQSGSNTVEVIADVKKDLARIQKQLPSGVRLQIVRDNSTFISASIKALVEHLIFGSLLASLVVLLFIRNWRSVLIASVAIPTSIIATFSLLKWMNFTLNNMTLLGLTLAVGIVIDDAIVVLENIVRWMEEKDHPPKEAAIGATKEITLAVLATTISLVIIFVPVAFMTGYARRYVNQFGWTMAFSILVSMLVSFTLTPMLSSVLLKHERKNNAGHEHTTREAPFYAWIDRVYGRLLEWSMDHRAVIIVVSVLCFLAVFPLNRMVGRDFLPSEDQSEMSALIDAPVGSSIRATEKVCAEMSAEFLKFPEVEFVAPIINERPTHAHMYIRLVDPSKRNLTAAQVADKIRDMMDARFKNVRPRIAMPNPLGGGENNTAIQSRILGPDYINLIRVSHELERRVKASPNLVDVYVAADMNNPEFQINIDRKRASDLGVRAGDVASAVRLMMAGTDQISTYKEDNEQYDVTMQLLPEQQRNPAILAQLLVPSSRLGQVRLENVASIQRGYKPNYLDRYRRQFSVLFNASNRDGFPLDAAIREVEGGIRSFGLPPGYGFARSGTAKVLDETTQNLIIAFLLASIFMYMVLAAQFESFIHPFTIMLSLPLAIPFALLSLWLTHRTLNLWSALGVFLLLGIVKKNGILQVDYTNKLREEGVPLREAIIQANHVRLRPILMTTISIIAGLIPTALGIGAGSSQRSAIAVTIIGGQSLCLLLTLLVTPVSYSIFAEIAERGVMKRASAGLSRMKVGVARMLSL